MSDVKIQKAKREEEPTRRLLERYVFGEEQDEATLEILRSKLKARGIAADVLSVQLLTLVKNLADICDIAHKQVQESAKPKASAEEEPNADRG